jgi:hypothetical protein
MPWLLRALAAAVCLVAVAPGPAHADFFDDMRRTFKSDIPQFFQRDVPHFFQDDIPCAFGGKPTSHTKSACKASPGAPARRPTGPPAEKTQPAPNDTQVRGNPMPGTHGGEAL